jgi:hypothetical protein
MGAQGSDSAAGVMQREAALARPTEPYRVGGWLFLAAIQSVVSIIAHMMEALSLPAPPLGAILIFDGMPIAFNLAVGHALSAFSTIPGDFRGLPAMGYGANAFGLWLINHTLHEGGPVGAAPPLEARIAWSIVWLIYLVRSKRVRNTFRKL